MESFSVIKLISFGLVFLFFFSIPVLTVTQIQKVDNENKVKYDLRQIEAWAQVYKMKSGTFQDFENDVEIRMLKIDIAAMTGKNIEMHFSEGYQNFCVKANTNKNNTYCVDDSGYLGKENEGCVDGIGSCKLKVVDFE
jgi:hypothetical protein